MRSKNTHTDCACLGYSLPVIINLVCLLTDERTQNLNERLEEILPKQARIHTGFLSFTEIGQNSQICKPSSKENGTGKYIVGLTQKARKGHFR